MTQLTQPEASFIKEMYRVRKVLADYDINSFDFSMRAEGRCSTGDVLVKYRISEYSYSEHVEAGSVEACLREFLRRKGFAQENNQLCLPSVIPEEISGEQKIVLDLKEISF